VLAYLTESLGREGESEPLKKCGRRCADGRLMSKRWEDWKTGGADLGCGNCAQNSRRTAARNPGETIRVVQSEASMRKGKAVVGRRFRG